MVRALTIVLAIPSLGCPPAPTEDPAPRSAADEAVPRAQLGADAWTRLSDLDPAQQAQRDRAQQAAQRLGKSLVEALTGAIQEEGLPGAVAFCNERALPLTAAALPDGVTIGRTSHKLRNPANSPPAWAESLVAERLDAPAYLTGPDGRFAALLPIKTQAKCLLCHGQPDGIAPAVQEVLAERYASDQATGFSEGDLRGWFWVEVAAD